MTTRTTYNPREDPVLRDFLAATREAVGKDPVEVLLFGSRARGDYDLIIVYDEVTREMKRLIRHVRSLVGLRHTAVISTFAIAVADVQVMSHEPFVVNARREGVRLA